MLSPTHHLALASQCKMPMMMSAQRSIETNFVCVSAKFMCNQKWLLQCAHTYKICQNRRKATLQCSTRSKRTSAVSPASQFCVRLLHLRMTELNLSINHDSDNAMLLYRRFQNALQIQCWLVQLKQIIVIILFIEFLPHSTQNSTQCDTTRNSSVSGVMNSCDDSLYDCVSNPSSSP